ncbi:GNAT family N-acetyltransferase [Novosphingobium piscinae]|uniref:GNAT family N-acetyltransferase n=1 Tax=Novosphingobium piscinae TaxID=1507448 RepID=A0A7X1FZS7_9SPHN|nr:GNAT family N-acetyltransferase [Novosphingobium piscinae]MBC2670011.1 GNAT family N-acetyltransferase [Novosphingobium piscinae]
MDIREDDLTDPQTLELLRLHREGMLGGTPAEHAYVLDLGGLRQPGITVWTAWRDGRALGIAALKQFDATSGEIKSMRTHPAHLRQGVAARLLDHVIATARARGLRQLMLETGTAPSFDPALALYRRHGFRTGPVFADYQESPYNQFLHLALD